MFKDECTLNFLRDFHSLILNTRKINKSFLGESKTLEIQSEADRYQSNCFSLIKETLRLT